MFVAVAATVGGADHARAQTAAPGVEAPNEPRVTSDGQLAPPPAARSNGGVGSQEVPFDQPQTRSGGPVGGNRTQQQ